jgi:hypothetical protein
MKEMTTLFKPMAILVLLGSAASAQMPGDRMFLFDRTGAPVGTVDAPDDFIPQEMREFVMLCRARDPVGIERMATAGKLQPIPSGTPCIVIRMVSDPDIGPVVWVRTDRFPYKHWVRPQDLAVPQAPRAKSRRKFNIAPKK